jgi:hypothetical protein
MMPNAEQRKQYIADLRSLVDFLEAHPEIPLNEHSARIHHCVLIEDDALGTATVEMAARELGVPTNHRVHVTAEKSFGCAMYRIFYVPDVETRRHEAANSYYRVVQPDSEVV